MHMCSMCYEDELEKHIRKCPTRLAQQKLRAQPWFRLNVNAGSLSTEDTGPSADTAHRALARGATELPPLDTPAERSALAYELGVPAMRALFGRIQAAAKEVSTPLSASPCCTGCHILAYLPPAYRGYDPVYATVSHKVDSEPAM